MTRTLALLAFLALVLGPATGLGVGRVLAQDNPEKTDQGETDQGDKEDNKKVDKYLGIDWGEDKDAPKDTPDAKQPNQKVDLEQALAKVQFKRLEKIKEGAAKADKMKEHADKAYSGEDKKLRKADSIKLYDNAGKMYRRPILDIDRLAKQIKDEDARLTLLREYGDQYKDQACEMFCKAAGTVIELSKTMNDLKRAGVFLRSARQVDPKHPAIEAVRKAAREKAKEIMTLLAEAKKQRTTGGGEKEEDDSWSDQDPRDERKYKEEGREEYKETGRP